MIKYLTDQEVIEQFGDPRPYIRPDGHMGSTWEVVTLQPFNLRFPIPLDYDPRIKVSKIRCHRRIVPFMQAAFFEIQDSPELRPLLKSFSGCYSWRRQRASRKQSRHGWGISLDINEDENHLGEPPNMDPRIVDVFNRQGFLWGGTFSRPDGMHFEFADLDLLLWGHRAAG